MKKIIIRILSSALIFTVVFGGITVEAAGISSVKTQSQSVTTPIAPKQKSTAAVVGKAKSTTYLYASASAKSKKLLRLGKGSGIEVLAISGSYYKARTTGKAGKTGYVPISGVSVLSGKALTSGKATASMYVYSSASASSKKIVSLRKGNTVDVYAVSGNYYKVNASGKTGYALRSRIKLGAGATAAKPATTPAPSPTVKPTATPVSTTAPTATPATAPTVTPTPSASPANPDAQGWYTINNAQFGIKSNGTSARATTDGINQALVWAKAQGYNKIRFSTGTYLIQCNWNNRYIAPTDGILVPSGMTLDLGASTFKLEANSYPAYAIFAVVGKSGVTITGGTLIGDLGQHVYASSPGSETHEWGFGICISASTNVLIDGVTIKNMTGDGIILEGSYKSLASGGKICSNIKIFDCDISGCRRQGISVIGATASEIARNRIHGISGTDPQYGIDVETEFDYVVDNLKIHNNTIYGCTGGAINCNKGSNYEVYANTCTGNNIIAVRCSNVKIYGNTIQNSFIRVMTYSSGVTVENNNLDANSWVFFG
ncbi:MAG: right-handed parallel beta-helix repeat-containing protein [Bacillota bacterium]